MKKRDKRMVKLVSKELGLHKGATSAQVLTALDELRDRARMAEVTLAKADAEKRIASRASTSRRSGLTAHDLHLLQTNPEIRRGFQFAQKRLEDGTWGLSDQQRQLAARMGITDRDALARLSAAMVKADVIRPPMPIPGEPGNPDFTPEQLRFLRRCGIEEPDPKDFRRQADAMRTGRGVEIELPKVARN